MQAAEALNMGSGLSWGALLDTLLGWIPCSVSVMSPFCGPRIPAPFLHMYIAKAGWALTSTIVAQSQRVMHGAPLDGPGSLLWSALPLKSNGRTLQISGGSGSQHRKASLCSKCHRSLTSANMQRSHYRCLWCTMSPWPQT